MTSKTPNLIRRRWRVMLAGALGIAGWMVARESGLPTGLSSLIGWNAAAVFYLVTTLSMIWRSDEATLRRRAAYEDENNQVTLLIVASTVVAGLAATVVAMHEAKVAGAHAAGPPAWVFSVSTLLLGWLVMQTMFTLHYAHRYFGDGDRDGEPDRGVTFPGDQPTSYHDFVYMAVCVGATAQVSDFNIMSTRYRRLVTQHALLSFFFNTAVLALGINILASLIGQ